jgi:hypothetical protein
MKRAPQPGSHVLKRKRAVLGFQVNDYGGLLAARVSAGDAVVAPRSILR